MSDLVQVRKKAQVTLPRSVRQALNIEEGDFLDVRVEGEEVVLRVKKLADKGQAWFWSRRWLEGERQAEADIKVGRVHHFSNADEAIAYLHQRTKRASPRQG